MPDGLAGEAEADGRPGKVGAGVGGTVVGLSVPSAPEDPVVAAADAYGANCVSG